MRQKPKPIPVLGHIPDPGKIQMMPGDQFPGFGQFGHDVAAGGGGLGWVDVEGDRGLGARELDAGEVDDVRPDQDPVLAGDDAVAGMVRRVAR